MERISTVIYFIVFKVKNFYSYRVRSIESKPADPLENAVCTPDKPDWLIGLVNRFMNISNYKRSIEFCGGKLIPNRAPDLAFGISPGISPGITPGIAPGFNSKIARNRGFTLIEIAIVLVVVTLILAGVLKGQSLIDSARVRSMATDVTGIRAAWYSFQDRYRSLPGDFPNARTQIDDATVPGNGNGRIDDSRERAGVWQQLALAGFIKGSFDGLESSAGTAQDMNCSASTCPRNPYNGFYKISYGTQAENAAGPAHEIFTGDSIPVNILAELDNKLDDGKADAGRFRVHRDFSGSCSVDGEWNVSAGHANCAGVLRD